MKASDIIVTKAGGNGISEILALKKPFIIREKSIINEKINKDLLVNNGIAMGIEKPNELSSVVLSLLENNDLVDMLKEKIKKLSKPNAADYIAKFLLETKREKELNAS